MKAELPSIVLFSYPVISLKLLLVLLVIPQIEVLTAGQIGALAFGALGGVLAFTLRAVREKTMIEKAEVGLICG